MCVCVCWHLLFPSCLGSFYVVHTSAIVIVGVCLVFNLSTFLHRSTVEASVHKTLGPCIGLGLNLASRSKVLQVLSVF